MRANAKERHCFRHANRRREPVRVVEVGGAYPRKSLTIGAIAVPDQFLLPLVRGLLDGDGSIINGVWQPDTSRRSGYYWEWLVTRFVSGSRTHLEWLHDRLQATLPLRGWIAPGHRAHALNFGKADSVQLMSRLYSDPAAPCLLRKRAIWHAYCERNGIDANLPG